MNRLFCGLARYSSATRYLLPEQLQVLVEELQVREQALQQRVQRLETQHARTASQLSQAKWCGAIGCVVFAGGSAYAMHRK